MIHPKPGFSLAVVLGLTALFSVLLMSLWALERQDSILSVQLHRKTQLKWVEQSVLRELQWSVEEGVLFQDYFRLDPADWGWASERSMADSTFRTQLWISRLGLSGVSFWSLASQRGIPKLRQAQSHSLWIQSTPLPALWILDSMDQFLVGAQGYLKGELRVATDIFRQADRYEIRHQGPWPLPVRLVDARQSRGDTAYGQPQWANIAAWLKRVLTDPTTDADWDCVHRSQSTIVIDAPQASCTWIAPRIIVEGNATLHNSQLIAQTILLKGQARLKWVQVMARDSLRVDLAQAQTEQNFFWVTGTQDSLPIPNLHMERYKGRAWVSLGRTKPYNYRIPQLVISKHTDLQGVIWTPAWVDFSGKLRGSLVAGQLAQVRGATFWVGFLLDGNIQGIQPSDKWFQSFRFPLVWPQAPLQWVPRQISDTVGEASNTEADSDSSGWGL
jgi:hypothetical protein